MGARKKNQVKNHKINQDKTLVEVINEVNSSPIIRQRLIKSLNKLTGRHTINYQSLFAGHPITFVNDWDAEVFENIFRGYGKKIDKVDLILHSSGGFAESAERVVSSIYNHCNDLRVIIPGQAKSAATMVAMGASTILMSDTSEIGSIDPQLSSPVGIPTPAQSIIKAYEELMTVIEDKQKNKKPIDAELVLLSKIDPVLLRESRKYMDLAKDIASKLLNKKMRLKNPISTEQIEENFLDDSKTFSHGRLIGWSEAKKLGLTVEYIDKYDEKWKLIWEIYIRTKIALERTKMAKIIEDENNSLNPGVLPVGPR